MQTAQKPAKRYYCYPASNEVEGPFELIELAGLLRNGHITGETQTLLEGEEQWLPFQERNEYHFAHEIPQDAIIRHAKERADAQESSFSPRKLLTFAWIMAPVLLYVLYRFIRLYLAYHLSHDLSSEAAAPNPTLDTPGGS